MNVEQISPGSKDYRQVKIAIGGKGKFYDATVSHFEISGVDTTGPQVSLLLPESVAEYFRQQGRRQLQSEMRALLNVSRG